MGKGTKSIYLAGPLFSEHERRYLEQLANVLAKGLGIDANDDIFLPHRDAGDIGRHGTGRDAVFQADIQAIDEAKALVALLDGQDVDSGTAVELGYAYACGKRIFGILTDWRRWEAEQLANINNMVWGACGKGARVYREVSNELIENIRNAIRD